MIQAVWLQRNLSSRLYFPQMSFSFHAWGDMPIACYKFSFGFLINQFHFEPPFSSLMKILAVSVVCSLISLLVGCQKAPSAMQKAQIGDYVLEYEIQGNGEPVLLIHGSVLADTFVALMPESALSDYQLIRYHRRGFADSSKIEAPFTLQDQAADAVALLDYLKIEKAHIVGHSYGAATALQLALDYPDRVHSIVTMEPPGIDIPGEQPPPQGIIDGMTIYQTGDSVAAIETFIAWAIGENWEEESKRLTPNAPAQARRDAKTFFEVEVPAMLQWQFGEEEANKISQPICYIMGDLSKSDITDSKTYLKSWIPQLEDHTVTGVNHALHSQDPPAVAAIIGSFIERNPM